MNKLEKQIEIDKCDMMLAECKERGKFIDQCIFIADILPYVGISIASFIIGVMFGKGLA